MRSEPFTAWPKRLSRELRRCPAMIVVYEELVEMSRYGKRPAYGGRIALARRTGLAQSTIQRCLAILERLGQVLKSFQSRGGRGISNAYEVMFTGCRAETSRVIAYTRKLTDAWVTRSRDKHTKEPTAAIENKPGPPLDPGSPKNWIQEISNSLKSSKP